MSFEVKVVRPGAARSRREAELFVTYTPCPSCGGPAYTQGHGVSYGEGDAVWEVLGRCRYCRAVIRALFEAGSGWTGGRSTPNDPDRVGNGRGPIPLMAAGRIASTILDPATIRRQRDDQLEELQKDCPLAGPDRPDDDEWMGTADIFGRDLLEALYELDLQAEAGRTTLEPEHAALKANVERIYVASGGELPTYDRVY
jgi:hypothetical protein